jgi:hypothetical protein
VTGSRLRGLAVLALPVFTAPVTRDGARDDARRELSKDVYRTRQTSAIRRIVDWILRHLSAPFDHQPHSNGSSVPLGWIAVIVVVIAIAALLFFRFGGLSRTAKREAFDLGPEDSTPEDHRSLADRFAEEGRYAEAVRERLRAVFRDLDRRGLVEARPGRTVTEIVALASRVLPSVAEPLESGARRFSEIWYAGRPADAEDDAALRDVETQVSAAKPGSDPAEAVAAGWSVPGGAPQ